MCFSFEKIQEFENEYKVKLPPKFVSFVHNLDEQFDYEITINGKEHFIGCILSFGKSEDDGSSIRRAIEYLPGCMNDGFLPFADNGGGDYYLIHLQSDKVFKWFHELDSQKDIVEVSSLEFFFSNLKNAF